MAERGIIDIYMRFDYYSGTESIHTSVCNATATAAAAATATTARFLISS